MTCTVDGFSAWGKDMGGYSSNPTVAAGNGSQVSITQERRLWLTDVNTVRVRSKNDRGYEWWATDASWSSRIPNTALSVAFTVGSWIEVLDQVQRRLTYKFTTHLCLAICSRTP